MSVKDPVCNGQGWLWSNPYHVMLCWRCAGTGQIEDVATKDNGPIRPESEGDDSETL